MASTSSASDFEMVRHNTVKHLPYFVVGQLNCKSGSYTIQPILPSDIREVTEFCEEQKIEVKDKMKDLFGSAVANNPFSVYVIRSQKSHISGLLIFNPDLDKGKVRMHIHVEKGLRRQQLGTAIWSWTVEQLFPVLAENRFSLGKIPLPDTVLELKGTPEFLAKKAESFGFVNENANKVHSIVIGKFLKKPPEDKKGWFGWW
ncbi:MAG: hypothetical protein K1X28_10945 [Parachlamydiales bacterium]|nr:hypothetical protein [Parachlamydiales bacterium]